MTKQEAMQAAESAPSPVKELLQELVSKVFKTPAAPKPKQPKKSATK